ncbi:c-type cytochrome [Arundinibacter roseus]|uniref:Cytochrome c n=1 Tax=Arundinibacter roseus TaxID=2070510 RepID=A0A4R4KAG7_9BACT|nr:cytochrome c [Arundinibacter roseus]TDB63672.1 cytochrome c [Arundinibacter roseus]
MNFQNKYSYVLAFAFLATAITSCNRDPQSTGLEFAPNMYQSVGYEPFRQVDEHPLNPMGLNMRKPVDGTVSRRNYNTSFGSGDSANVDIMVYNVPKDSISIAERTLTNPVPLNEKALAEGKVLYERYCQHCHGEGGAGDGLVGKAYKGVPNYKADAYLGMNGGHIFHVITHGKGRMWPHGSQLDPEERWKVVHYVQKLQKDS